jgi:hypothetical protein
MRIDAAGSVGIGGVPTAGRSLDIIKNPTGATNAVGVLSGGVVQSDVTSSWSGFTAFPSVAAATFTVGALNHFYAQQNVIGAGSAVTNQFGFRVDGTLTGATNNYAFYSAIAAGANRYNLYMQGTADNYLAGALGIGAVPGSVVGLRVSKNITGAATAYGVLLDSTIQSDVTGSAIGIRTSLSTAATAFNITGLQHFRASLASQGAGSTLSTQYGFIADSSLVGATTNYGFYSDLPIGAGNYNFYANSTAKSYFGGNVGIGSGKTSPATALDVNGTVTSTAVSINGVGLVDSTTLTTSVATTDQVLDTNAITAIRAVKYQITVNSGAAYSYTEVRVLHDGTNVYMSETNTMNSGAALATFNADINAGNLRLLTTPVNAVTTYKVVAIAVAV